MYILDHSTLSDFVAEQKTTDKVCKASKLVKRVTDGEFGEELEWYTTKFDVPDKVVKFLKLSATFLKMACALDRSYIANHSTKVPRFWQLDWKPNRDGVFTVGKFEGRRMLLVNISNVDPRNQRRRLGSRFSPSGSPENTDSMDIIWLKPPDITRAVGQKATVAEIGQWIESISHETTHAFHRVTRRGRYAKSIATRIRDKITEEAATRATELKILLQIRRHPGGHELSAFRSTTGSINIGKVERDFFPSELLCTYLEYFTLSEFMLEAIRHERLGLEDIEAENEFVSRIPLGDRTLDSFLQSPTPHPQDPRSGLLIPFFSEYARLRFLLRVIDARWKRFLNRHSQSDPNFNTAQEPVLQEHAGAFFGNIIKYTPR